MQADLLLYNGDLIPVTQKIHPKNRALVIKEGRIAAIGSREDLTESYFCKEDLDLQGRTVIPGFIDAHVHFLLTGLNRLGCNLHQARSRDDLLLAVKEAASHTPWGTLIFGSGYDESQYPGHHLPGRRELDSVTHDHPVFLSRVDCHSCLVNTPAFELLDLPAEVEGVEYQAGEPSGRLFGLANTLARNQFFSSIPLSVKRQAIQEVTGAALEQGITTIHALEGWEESPKEDLLLLLEEEKNLPLDLILYYQTTAVEEVLRLGLPRIGGCVMLDGSIGSSSAAISTPYSQEKENRGILYFTDEELLSFVEEAHQANLQIATHVIGHRAIQQMLQVYQQVLTRYPRPQARHRLEHFELPAPGQIAWAKELNLILSMQPAFDYFWGGEGQLYQQRLGDRYREMNPLRQVYEAGIVLAGGSDSDVTPLHPLLGIHGAVNHSQPASALTISQALRLFTINNAYAAFSESEQGSLEPGKLAHLTILSENPLQVQKERLQEIQVEMTLYQGEVVFEKTKE